MDRFDLEDKITAMSNINEELNVLSRRILEENLDNDDIINAINGIIVLQDGRHNELFDTFTQVFKLDQYSEAFYAFAEDTNQSVDLDFNGVRSCCRKSCGND